MRKKNFIKPILVNNKNSEILTIFKYIVEGLINVIWKWYKGVEIQVENV